MKIEDINTDAGYEIIEQLTKDGWKIKKQYHPLAFDKGIDFDSYTLKKGKETLHFEWDNWFEWNIEGSDNEINALITYYNLSAKQS